MIIKKNNSKQTQKLELDKTVYPRIATKNFCGCLVKPRCQSNGTKHVGPAGTWVTIWCFIHHELWQRNHPKMVVRFLWLSFNSYNFPRQHQGTNLTTKKILYHKTQFILNFKFIFLFIIKIYLSESNGWDFTWDYFFFP